MRGKLAPFELTEKKLADVKAQLSQSTSDLEVTRHRIVAMGFETTVEQKKMAEAQQACIMVRKQLEEVLSNTEELRDLSLKEKEEKDMQIADLMKSLAAERPILEAESAKNAELAASLASKHTAYPDFYAAAIEQFKQSFEFQMTADIAVAASLAKKGV